MTTGSFMHENLHERYHLVQIHPLSQNKVTDAWFLEKLIIMVNFKMAAVKSMIFLKCSLKYLQML